jgi:phospho-N-acetylmuramoyl-pentapeptide-transferase
MFYWLYLQYSHYLQSVDPASGGYVPFLNLLKYQTLRTGLAIFTAQLVVVAMGSRFIRWMKARQGKGQPIRAEGIERHIIEKAGTPTMGGVMILAGLFAGTLLWADLTNVYVWAVMIVTGGYGFLGFLDDYSKVTKQTTAGISGRLRLVLEAAIAMIAVALIIQFAAKPPESPELLTSITFPVFKQWILNLNWFYLGFGAFIIVGAANAVNFTDGLDGLATVPVMIASAAYGLIAYLVGNYVFANYLQLHFVPGVGELAVFCGALIGSGLGFLWYNAPPAKIFMGDTGALALGGAVGAIAVSTRHEIVLGVIGGLFVAELLSVVIQVAWFKRTGRRIFLMAPIHHHFEKLGWSESTVVIRFWIVSIMLALLGLATLKLR